MPDMSDYFFILVLVTVFFAISDNSVHVPINVTWVYSSTASAALSSALHSPSNKAIFAADITDIKSRRIFHKSPVGTVRVKIGTAHPVVYYMHHVSRFAFAAHKRGAGYKVWISTAELRKPYKRADLLSMIRMMHKVVFYKPKLKAARSSWAR